ncbi:hypothetical protein [Leucobacter sp. OH1287]|uniref:hypothetical protein n=1 Tax=Leucobacter sp. OH1287 TaxID=2491049 RepID=UPI000F5E9878|nr:hypothetical protein [Leucobacter sp. OH1287]RRD61350.1 hypothetical protein EII30_02835 [Leucobacter sp. OH1287]
MTKDEDILEAAIIAQLNAEIAAAGLSMMDIARLTGRPYDSTRNYLKRERAINLKTFLDICDALKISPDIVIRRARERID